MNQHVRRIVIGVSGASGIPLTRELLLALRAMGNVETHIIISDGARKVIEEEHRDPLMEQLEACADHVHDCRDIGAGPASGSW